MKYSILIPVYNAEKYLAECIDSVLNQTFSDFELILAVDGSPDNSIDICRVYSNQDNRVKVIEKENGGVVSARKSAANEARGDYVICVDSDDYLHPELLSQLSSIIDKQPEVEMICFGYCEDNQGVISKPMFHDLPEGYIDIDFLRSNYLYNSSCKEDNNGSIRYPLWTKCIKRDIYVSCQNKIPDYIKNGDDVLCTAWVLSSIRNCFAIRFPGYYYRYNESSLTHVRRACDLDNVSKVKDEIEKIECFSHENIGHYYLLSVYILLRDTARLSKKYHEYSLFLNNLQFDRSYGDLRFYYHHGIVNIIRYSLIQKECWRLLFLIIKIFHL